MTIIINYEELKYSSKKFAEMCIVSDNVFFPSEDWTDFAADILSDWAHVVRNNQSNALATFDLYFMDGPYIVTCERRNDLIKISGMREDESAVFSEIMKYSDFESLIFSTSEKANKSGA